MSLMSVGLDAVERGLIPDAITRVAIRRLCAQRLRESNRDRAKPTGDSPEFQAFVESIRAGPIAPVPEKANQQHYELPPEFFAAVLGPRRKYSCCFWPAATTTLAEAEAAALEITCDRADLADGQEILELGCGWGSLSLRMAERYRGSRITAVSNSAPQRRFIEAAAASLGLTNPHVITADMNEFTLESDHFDRVVSVEMFEHMRNYERLLERIASWLRSDGKLFVHHFCHRTFAYPCETDGDANWMGRYFFTGGLMPRENMLTQFDRHMTVAEQWRWDGTHYQRTSEAVGDFQMARFQANPQNAGRVMDRGLWRLTRHPNYFGDFCVWWGLYLIASAGGAAWTIFSPLLMSFLLLRVSGVTLLEKTITDRRPDYAAYQARTSSFFPWPPSKSSNDRSSGPNDK